MALLTLGIKLASKLKKEATALLNSSSSKAMLAYVKTHPWTAAFNTAIAGMSIPDIEDVWSYIQSAINGDVNSVEEMMEIMAKDSNVENLVIEKVNSMMPTDRGLYDLIPPIWRDKHSEKAKILARQWMKRREMLDGKSIIHKTDDKDEMYLRIATIDNVSSFFGVHSDPGLRALHSSLRAFVNTSSESIERTLQVRGNK
jgi:hypothetical protein